tara:strand:+ start:403 stop:600 length:198 start_codon:yes stop_codon:yes gene_type:complete
MTERRDQNRDLARDLDRENVVNEAVAMPTGSQDLMAETRDRSEVPVAGLCALLSCVVAELRQDCR